MTHSDFEILQIYARRKNGIQELFTRLSVIQCEQLYILTNDVYALLLQVLNPSVCSKILNLANDHLLDFCTHIMSLPIDRIIAMINNPVHELTWNRNYYVSVEGHFPKKIKDFII